MKGLKELIERIRKETDLTEDQVREELNKILPETWVPKAKFNEALENEKLAKNQLTATKDQLEELKKSATLTEEQKNQLTTLEAQLNEQKEAHEAEVRKLRLTHEIEKALGQAKAKNITATRALLDEKKIVLGDDGKLAGLREQLEEIQKSNEFLFEVEEQQAPAKPTFGGQKGSGPLTTEQALKQQFANALLGGEKKE